MKFAVANQFLMIADQAGVDYTNVLRAIRDDYPRAADLPGPGFAAGPCLFKDTMQLAAFTTDHFPMGQAAMQVNEGLPAYIVSALRAALRHAPRQDGRHPRHGLQGRVGRHPGVAVLQAAQAPRVGRRAGAVHGPVRDGRAARARSTRCSPSSDDPRPRRAAPRVPRRSTVGGETSSTSGTRPGDGIRLYAVKVLVTGAAGFICGYLVQELLERRPRGRRARQLQQVRPGREVVRRPPALPVRRGRRQGRRADDRARGRLRPGRRGGGDDRRDQLLPRVRVRPAGRERADPRLDVRRGDRRAQGAGRSSGSSCCSSSMVFESTTVFPTPEGAERTSPPPISTYGFQKLASEYFAHGAWEQYQLPYTILRPFNCVGIGERRALRDTDIMSGNVKLALSHVVPDLALKALKGQDPLHILGDGIAGPALHVRRRPRARDPPRDGVAEAAATTTSTSRRRPRRPCSSSPRRSGRRSTATDKPFRYVSDPPFEHDVQLRVPDVRKAREVLGFEATTSLDDDARRGHPVDPRRARGGTVVTELSIVVPVFKEGRGGRARAASARRRRHDPARDPGRVRLR